MPGRDEHASEHWTGEPQRRLGGAAFALSAVARALEPNPTASRFGSRSCSAAASSLISPCQRSLGCSLPQL